MANRIIKWLIFTVLFAFIPTFISLLFDYLLDGNKQPYDFLSEVLFFTIMVCSNALTDIINIRGKLKAFLRTLFIGGFLFLLIFSAILYGGMLFAQLSSDSYVSFKSKAFTISLILAIFSFLAGITIQAFLDDGKGV